MITAGIAGASGYTGAELATLLTNHPQVDLCAITSNRYKGQSLTHIFPQMPGFENLTCLSLDDPAIFEGLDVIFLALPHKVSMAHAPAFLEKGIKVIDLSADYRFSDISLYEAAYQPHTSGHLLEKSVYGLSEIYREQIKTCDLLGNPGCYPTTILLALIPLLKEKAIETRGIISDSKSGVSGAGRGLSLGTHFSEVNESFKAYKIGNHRHTPEINEQLSLQAGEAVQITFTPHLLPITRGMLSTLYLQAQAGMSEIKIREIYKKWYADEPFVRVYPKDEYPAISHVRGNNCCDIGFHFDNDNGRITVISAIDNLLKGAAGQAVQNMNIMFGINEESGLNMVTAPL